MAGRRCKLGRCVLTTVFLLYGLLLMLQSSRSLLQPLSASVGKHPAGICNTSQPYHDCMHLNTHDKGNHANTAKTTEQSVRQITDTFISDYDPSEEVSASEIVRSQDVFTSNIYNYKLLINQPMLCAAEVDESDLRTENSDAQSPFLLIIVHSHLLNVARRNAIRQTWARNVLRYHSSLTSQIVFLLGSHIDHDNSTVHKESSLYHDILQWDFQDAYHNLTLKSILGLSWAQKFCSHARFVLKTDDDVYLNISSILNFLQQKHGGFHVIGNVNPSSSVMRVGQWGVSKADYPSFTYPPYCSGAAYVISRYAVTRLMNMARFDRRVFPVEDVYITGILPNKLRLICSHNAKFPKWETLFKSDNLHTFLNDKLFGIHGVSSEKMYTLRRIVHECQACRHNKTAIEEIMQQDEEYFNFYDDVEEGFTDVLRK